MKNHTVIEKHPWEDAGVRATQENPDALAGSLGGHAVSPDMQGMSLARALT